MSIFVPKRAKPRRFDYQPRYYDPSKDRDEKLKRRIRVQRLSRTKRKGAFTNLIYFAALLLFAAYLYNLLG